MHCTRYGGDISTMLDINASIIQGSALGPVANASDLKTVTPVTGYIGLSMTPTSLYQPVTLSLVKLNLTMLKNGHRPTT